MKFIIVAVLSLMFVSTSYAWLQLIQGLITTPACTIQNPK